ncbi:MAG: serine/threonine-protein kinase [Prochloraceae cyanobacterium]|nr:serine/threonine-protein kinase [Prochloraceae cyanobacterium]
MKIIPNKTLQKGKYILVQELGQGGFGVTYKAINQILNEEVVIKTLKLNSTQDKYRVNLRKQFLDEARRLLKCSHPHIVRLREFFTEDELPYIVMDYIPGPTLDKVVMPDNPLPEATAIEYIRQVGEALKVVHQNGLLHRDVKPQNLILRQDTQEVVLIDFGIAREFRSGTVQTHTSLFSEGYAPIEQYILKAQRTPATDIYGLAATLYTLLTAQVPIAASLRDRMPMQSPKEIKPRLSKTISEVVMWGMAVELQQRPATVDQWLKVLLARDNNRSGISAAMQNTSLMPTKSDTGNHVRSIDRDRERKAAKIPMENKGLFVAKAIAIFSLIVALAPLIKSKLVDENQRNMTLLKSWNLQLTACDRDAVSIYMKNEKYCVEADHEHQLYSGESFKWNGGNRLVHIPTKNTGDKDDKEFKFEF